MLLCVTVKCGCGHTNDRQISASLPTPGLKLGRERAKLGLFPFLTEKEYIYPKVLGNVHSHTLTIFKNVTHTV